MRHKAIALLGISAISLLVALDASADERSALATRPVRVTGDAATVQMDDDGWVNLCRIPCDRAFLARGTYRIIGGANVRTSGPFRLEGEGPLTLNVHAASPVMRDVGIGMMVSGGVVIVGVALAVFAILSQSSFSFWGGGRASSSSILVAEYLLPAAFFGAGIGPIAAGLIVHLAAPRTKVVQSTTTTATRTPEWIDHRVTPAPTNLGWTFTF